MKVHCVACGADFDPDLTLSGSSTTCPTCGGPVTHDAATHSSRAPSQPASPAGSESAASQGGLFGRVSDRISSAAGVQKLQGFSLGETFSEVFGRHSDEEIERYFSVGGPDTTPPLERVDVRWPKPWVFFRTFLVALGTYIAFVAAWNQFGNVKLLPAIIFVGSFAIPFATLILFFELNVQRNVSLYQICRLVALGGAASLLLSLLGYQVASGFKLDWLGASLAGLVEEPGKLLVLAFVINNRRYRSVLNGLLLGAAVGAGFAAFESAGYAFLYLLQHLSVTTHYNGAVTLELNDIDAMRQLIVARGLLAPFGHIAWTAMSAAALWRVMGGAPFRFEMLKDSRFTRVFATAVLLHMIWDSPLELPFDGLYVLLGAVAWIIVLGLVQEGLAELRASQAAARAGTAAAAEAAQPALPPEVPA
ncbi:MAG TPA: PrsW family glutamic-type intramembrane protease [Steroidobacteraceae bacterium]|nr:PrsW family glutamic-type intramembrane protease [Steroidobacteraceae bacterium]